MLKKLLFDPFAVANRRRSCDDVATDMKLNRFAEIRAAFAQIPMAIIVWSNQGL